MVAVSGGLAGRLNAGGSWHRAPAVVFRYRRTLPVCGLRCRTSGTSLLLNKTRVQCPPAYRASAAL